MFYIVTLTYQNGTNDCRPRPTKLQSCQVVIRNERDILNVVTSKAPKVASRPWIFHAYFFLFRVTFTVMRELSFRVCV